MRKNILPSILFSLFILLSSCEKVQKDVNAYYPDVTTVSATLLADGSVAVKGEIINSGTSDLEYIGFCMDTVSPPSMLSNQMIVSSINGNIFSANYSTWFEPNKPYYFRSWATNAKGYSYGNIITVDSIKAIPLVIPCSPPMNSISLGFGSSNVYGVNLSSYNSNFPHLEVLTSGTTYNFNFGSKLRTKIYTVAPTLGPDNVQMTFNFGISTASLKEGSLVYVSQTSAYDWIITICAAQFITPNGSGTFTGKFQCPK